MWQSPQSPRRHGYMPRCAAAARQSRRQSPPQESPYTYRAAARWNRAYGASQPCYWWRRSSRSSYRLWALFLAMSPASEWYHADREEERAKPHSGHRRADAAKRQQAPPLLLRQQHHANRNQRNQRCRAREERQPGQRASQPVTPRLQRPERTKQKAQHHRLLDMIPYAIGLPGQRRKRHQQERQKAQRLRRFGIQ